MNDKKILIVGGDMRIVYLAGLFLKNGFNIKVFGIDQNPPNLSVPTVNNLKEAADRADIIVLPLPVLKDKNHINAPFFNSSIAIDELTENLDERHIVIGGKFSDGLKKILSSKKISFYDYFDDETLTMKNAAVTAECAVMLAIKNSEISLMKSKCMILGFGRIAKFLARMLKGFGGQVCVAARSESALAEAEFLGCETCGIYETGTLLEGCDIVFNTVPTTVLGEKELVCLPQSSIVIDLASNPGGVDLNAANDLNINLIHALSLPGKYAPKSSGEIIYKTAVSIINSVGGDSYES